jgi:hypothetical protein
MSKSLPKRVTWYPVAPVGDPNLIQILALFPRVSARYLYCNNQFRFYCSTIPTRAESSSMGSQLYVEEHAALAQLLTKFQIAQLKGVRLIRSPHHSLVPPSPLYHFLSAFVYLSCVYVCLLLREMSQCLTDVI